MSDTTNNDINTICIVNRLFFYIKLKLFQNKLKVNITQSNSTHFVFLTFNFFLNFFNL